jgi:hypothetical protein
MNFAGRKGTLAKSISILINTVGSRGTQGKYLEKQEQLLKEIRRLTISKTEEKIVKC